MKIWHAIRGVLVAIGVIAIVGAIALFIALHSMFSGLFGTDSTSGGIFQTNSQTRNDAVSIPTAQTVVQGMPGLEAVGVTSVMHSFITPTEFNGDRLNIYVLSVTGFPLRAESGASPEGWYRGPFTDRLTQDLLRDAFGNKYEVPLPDPKGMNNADIYIQISKLNMRGNMISDVIIAVYDASTGVLYYFVDLS